MSLDWVQVGSGGRSASASWSATELLRSSKAQAQLEQRQQPTSNGSIDPQQLCACIQAATTFTQLQAVCNTFMGHAAFGPQQAALVLSRLHLVRSRPTDSHLLLVELLAELLPPGCCTHHHHQGSPEAAGVMQQQQQPVQDAESWQCQHQLSCGQAAAVCWAFSKAGYQPAPQLLQLLLQQFWVDFGQQQQHRGSTSSHEQAGHTESATSSSSPTSAAEQHQQWPPTAGDEALATLVAGLAGLGCRDASCWQRLRAAVQVALSDSVLPMHSLQQLTWGFAAVQQGDAATVDVLAATLRGRLAELATPEDLVQSMWSLHLMGCTDRSLFEAAAHVMLQHLGPGSSASRGKRAPAAAAPADGANSGTRSQQPVLLPQLPSRSAGGSASPSAYPRVLQHQKDPEQLVVSSKQAARQDQLQALATVPNPQRLLSAAAGQTAALCSAAATQAFNVLHKYDPLLCMLALYRDYYRPAHSM